MDVLERPAITSPESFTFFEGMPASGEVTTRGYPVNAYFANCGDISCADMRITFRWPDPRRIDGLTLADRSAVAFATGIGRFDGVIPSGSRGVYRIDLTASNGTWAPEYRQQARLIVLPTPDLNGDGQVDCQDLQAIKNAAGRVVTAGTGFDLNGDSICGRQGSERHGARGAHLTHLRNPVDNRGAVREKPPQAGRLFDIYGTGPAAVDRSASDPA